MPVADEVNVLQVKLRFFLYYNSQEAIVFNRLGLNDYRMEAGLWLREENGGNTWEEYKNNPLEQDKDLDSMNIHGLLILRVK